MKRRFISMAMILGLFTIGQESEAQTPGIANVTIPFAGSLSKPEETRELIAGRMKALIPDAANAGVNTIHLQSVAYSLTPGDRSYNAEGNLFIDVVPESRTFDFVALLQKRGLPATINYFQPCRPR